MVTLAYPDARFVYGMDPAQFVDFFGIVVHRLDVKAEVPKLQTLRKIRDEKRERKVYIDVMNMLIDDLFPRFPPALIKIDATHEQTFAQLLAQKRYRVDPVSFDTSSKLRLKQNGLKIMQMGYTFPDPARISDPILAQWVDELIEQLKHEQVISNPSNSSALIKFDHPQGDHNDLAHAWELSVEGCLDLMQSHYSYKIRAVGKGRS